MAPARNRASASLACASGYRSTWTASAIFAASARNASPSRRVRFATERTLRFAPQQPIGEGWNVAHVDAGADDRAAPRGCGQGGGDEGSGRAKISAASSSAGDRSSLPQPNAPESPREGLRIVVAGAGEREHRPSLRQRHLRDEVRAAPKP